MEKGFEHIESRLKEFQTFNLCFNWLESEICLFSIISLIDTLYNLSLFMQCITNEATPKIEKVCKSIEPL